MIGQEQVGAKFDVFISYRHSAKEQVKALCERLKAAGVTYFRDEERRDDDASIQHAIERGLAHAKLLLAWYDPTYLQSKACIWELSRALIASYSHNEQPNRIFCLNPVGTFDHIVPETLRDRAYIVDLDHVDDLMQRIRVQTKDFEAAIGRVDTPTQGSDWLVRGIPFHPTWVGRAAELLSLLCLMSQGNREMHGAARAPVAVTGWGGDGKTMLVEQYGLRFAAAYPGGVVWLSGATADGVTPRSGGWLDQLEREIGHIAIGTMGTEEIKKRVAELDDQRQRVRALKQAINEKLVAIAKARGRSFVAPYLWIVDDLPPNLNAEEQRLWLAPNPTVHSLITVREAAAVKGLMHVLQLPTLSSDEALALLTQYRPPGNEAELDAARRILGELGGLPLALDLAGRAVENRTYACYLQLLQEPSTATIEALSEACEGVLPTGHAASVTKTFLRSIDRLPADAAERDSHAHACWLLLRAVALLAPLPLPDAAALHLLQATGLEHSVRSIFQKAIETLARIGLVIRAGKQPQDTRIHSLLARTVRDIHLDKMQSNNIKVNLLMAGIKWLEEQGQLPPVSRDVTFPGFVLRLMEINRSELSADLASLAASLASECAWYQKAHDLLEMELQLRNELQGEDHFEWQRAANNLAMNLVSLGRPAAAREFLQSIVDSVRKDHSENDRLVLVAKGNLADVNRELGHVREALTTQRYILARTRRIEGDNHVDTARAANNLALTLGYMRRFREAEKQLTHALEIARRFQGDEHELTAQIMSNLSEVLRRRRKFDAAERIARLSFDIALRRVGEYHSVTVHALNALALIAENRGDLPGARDLLERALEGARRVFGEHHYMTLTVMHNLAMLMKGQGDLYKAQKLMDQVVVDMRREAGDDHSSTRMAISSLELIRITQTNQKKILQMLLWMPQAPRRAIFLRAIFRFVFLRAAGLGEFRDLVTAEGLPLEKMVELCKRVLGPDSPETMFAIHNLAQACGAKGDFASASHLQRNLLESCTRTLTPHHPNTLTAMGNLALTLQAQCDLAGARALRETVLEIRRRVLGAEHPDTLTAIWSLYETLLALKGLPEAERFESSLLDDTRQGRLRVYTTEQLLPYFDERRRAHGLPPRS